MSVVCSNFTCSVKVHRATWILRFLENHISVNCPDKQIRFSFDHNGNIRFDKVKDRFPGGSTTYGYFESGNMTLEVWLERGLDEEDTMRSLSAGVRLCRYETGKREAELFHFHLPCRVARALIKLGQGLTEFREIHLTGESAVMGEVISQMYPGRA